MKDERKSQLVNLEIMDQSLSRTRKKKKHGKFR